MFIGVPENTSKSKQSNKIWSAANITKYATIKHENKMGSRRENEEDIY